MPDSYTHAHIAFHALLRAHQSVASFPCYLAGANATNVFDFFGLLNHKSKPDLATLSDRIHKENTGLFLKNLLKLSITPQQQSYTLGFLTHHTTDCALNPYISAMGDMGLFKGKGGRLSFEASLDSLLFYQNYRIRTVPLYAATPILLNEDLGQVSKLLHDAVLTTYNIDVPSVHFADAFHENYRLRKQMISPRGVRKACAKVLLPLLCGKNRALNIVSRMQPGPVLPALPEKWKNPYSLQEMHLSFDEVISLAEDLAAASIVTAMRYWLLEIDESQLEELLGNNNCYTGQPVCDTPPSPPQKTCPCVVEIQADADDDDDDDDLLQLQNHNETTQPACFQQLPKSP